MRLTICASICLWIFSLGGGAAGAREGEGAGVGAETQAGAAAVQPSRLGGFVAASQEPSESEDARAHRSGPLGQYFGSVYYMFNQLALREKLVHRNEIEKRLSPLARTGQPTVAEEQLKEKDVTWKVRSVRTGTEHGRPVGFLHYSTTVPDTQAKLSVTYGTRASVVTQRLGKDSVTMIVQNENLYGKDGKVRVPAGHVTLRSEETSAQGKRTVISYFTPDGTIRQLTKTQYADGRAEQFTAVQDPTGKLSETRVRHSANGRQTKSERSLEGKRLHIVEEDAKTKREQVLTEEQTARLIGRLNKAIAGQRTELKEYRHRIWGWKDQFATAQGLGTISASGKADKLARLKSGFVSPLGTRYGELEERSAPVDEAKRPRAPKLVRTRVNIPQPEGSILSYFGDYYDPEDVDLKSYPKAIKAKELIAKGTGIVPELVIDPNQPSLNAHFRFGEAPNRIRLGPAMAGQPVRLQAAVDSHELGHGHDAKLRSPAAMVPIWKIATYGTAGHSLAANVANLVYADDSRGYEQTADQAAGKALAQINREANQPHMSPRALARFLRKHERAQSANGKGAHPLASRDSGRVRPGIRAGLPRKTNWTPLSGYAPASDRSHTLWSAFHRERQRLDEQSQAAPAPTSASASASPSVPAGPAPAGPVPAGSTPTGATRAGAPAP